MTVSASYYWNYHHFCTNYFNHLVQCFFLGCLFGILGGFLVITDTLGLRSLNQTCPVKLQSRMRVWPCCSSSPPARCSSTRSVSTSSCTGRSDKTPEAGARNAAAHGHEDHGAGRGPTGTWWSQVLPHTFHPALTHLKHSRHTGRGRCVFCFFCRRNYNIKQLGLLRMSSLGDEDKQQIWE